MPTPIKITLTIISILLWAKAWAQVSPPRFHHQIFSTEEGLSQVSVYCMANDHLGFLWLGTADGLNRFDGHNFETFKRAEINGKQETFTNISSLLYDGKSHLYFTTPNASYCFNLLTNKFKKLQIPKIKYGLARTKALFNFANEVYIQIGNLGYATFESGQIKKYIPFPDSLKVSTPFFSRTLFTNGNALVQISGLSYSLNLKTQKFQRLNSFPNASAQLLLNDSESVGFDPLKNSLVIKSGKSYTYFLNKGYSRDFAIEGCLAYRNYILMPTNTKGILIYDKNKKQISHSLEPNVLGISTPIFISEIIEMNGTLFAGTNGFGLLKLSPYKDFKQLQYFKSGEDMVKGLFANKNYIISGNYGKGIVVYDKLKGTYKNLHTKNSPLETNVVSSICESTYPNKVWLYGQPHQLQLFDYVTGKFESFSKVLLPYIKGFKGSYNNHQIQKTNAYGVVFSLGPDLIQIDEKSNKPIFNVLLENKGKHIFALGFLPDKFIIGGYGNLSIYNKINQKNSLVHYFDGIEFRHVFIENSNSYWFATTTGLYHTDSNITVLRLFDETNGLPNSFVYGILKQEEHLIWLSHNKGLTRLNTKTYECQNFGPLDGLQSHEFNTGAFCWEGNNLYFGGINGINWFNGADIKTNVNCPKPILTNLKIFEEPLKSDTQISFLKELRLSHTNNTLSIDYTAANFGSNTQNTYAYKLEGFEKEWVNNGTKQFIRYANLPPGQYRFLLKAANSDGISCENPLSFLLVIDAPFWKKNWFYALTGLSIILLLIAFMQYLLYRSKQKIKRELQVQMKLEQERVRISRDLHDHVGSQLSYLISNIDWILKHPENLNENELNIRLQSLEEAGKQAILTLRQTIWALGNNAISAEEFADRFKQFALKMMEFEKDIQIKFQEDISGFHVLSPALALNLFRICQEAFNNCLKHAHCHNIEVSFSSNEMFAFSFILKDDGIGFLIEEQKKKDHYGLNNMSLRAHEMGANLVITSAINEGTELRLTYNP